MRHAAIEALHAQWPEIDLDRRLWTIPAARTKSLREHVVPLSGVAIEVFERRLKARTGESGASCLPVRPAGSPINYSTFVRGLKAMGIDAGTPHSWRSIFRDWCGDVARIDRDFAEAALAHSLGATEASYRRQTAVEARRGPMEAYAKWLSGDAGADVIAFPARA